MSVWSATNGSVVGIFTPPSYCQCHGSRGIVLKPNLPALFTNQLFCGVPLLCAPLPKSTARPQPCLLVPGRAARPILLPAGYVPFGAGTLYKPFSLANLTCTSNVL